MDNNRSSNVTKRNVYLVSTERLFLIFLIGLLVEIAAGGLWAIMMVQNVNDISHIPFAFAYFSFFANGAILLLMVVQFARAVMARRNEDIMKIGFIVLFDIGLYFISLLLIAFFFLGLASAALPS